MKTSHLIKPLVAAVTIITAQQAIADCILTHTITDIDTLNAAFDELDNMECDDQVVTWNVAAGLQLSIARAEEFSYHSLVINGDADNPPTILPSSQSSMLTMSGGNPPYSTLTINDLILDGTNVSQIGAFVRADESGSIELNRVTMTDGAQGARVQGGRLEINDSDFLRFDSSSHGGAVQASSAEVIITNSTFSDNQVSGLYYGGALSVSDGDLTIVDSVFENNSAYDPTNDSNSGGAVYVGSESGHDVTVRGTTFRGNEAGDYAGAMRTSGVGNLTIEDSVFENNTVHVATNENGSGNTAESHGGALMINRDTTTTISDTTFSGNRANSKGGAIYVHNDFDNASTVTVPIVIERSSFLDNDTSQHPTENTSTIPNGGAIYINSERIVGNTLPSNHLQISQSVFAGNSSEFAGGAIYAQDGTIFTIENTTFDENSSTAGSAIFSLGDDLAVNTIHHSTFTDNVLTGGPQAKGGVPVYFADINNNPIEISHTIFAGNDFGDAQVFLDLSSNSAEFSYSFLDDQTNTSGSPYVFDNTNLLGGDGNAILDPELNALADNGGPTLSRYPADGSPLINAGNEAISDAPAEDQRGQARVVETIDIGAVEYGNLPPDVIRTSLSIEEGTSFNIDLTDYISDPEDLTLTFLASQKPSWLTVSGEQISGTAGAPGSYTLAVTVTDSVGWSIDANIAIAVTEAPKKSGGGGGALGGFVSLLAGLLLLRRKH